MFMYKIFPLIFLFSAGFTFAQNQDVTLKIDGKVVEVEKEKDLKIYKEFYDSGKVKISGFKKKGKLDGLFFYYDKKGNILYKILYRNNRIIYTNFVGHKNGFRSNHNSDKIDN